MLSTIISGIKTALNAARTPAPVIPPLFLLKAVSRPGLSALTIANNIISRQSDAGAPVGALPDGTPSIAEKMERIRIEEIVKALKYDARIDIGIPPGIPIISNGANAAGAVISVGSTTGIGIGTGIIV